MNQENFSRPVELKQTAVRDGFWTARQELVRTEVLPYQWDALNDNVEGAAPSYCMHNFRAAAALNEKGRKGRKAKPPVDTFRGVETLPEDPENPDPDRFYGFVFQDTDFSKWVEAVGYSLTRHPDPVLEETADKAIDIVCAAQLENGYLDTYYILNGMEEAFTNLRDHHELYCLGHLIEGAIAYHQATGKDKLLRAAMRFADYCCSRFGPGENQCKGYPGHEIAEMALAKLYETTGEKKYLDLASVFLDQRGTEPLYYDLEEKARTEKAGGRYRKPEPGPDDNWFERNRGWYMQAHKPVREQDEAVGHAVRAVYLYSGMADMARLTGDETLLAACRKLWDSIVNTKLYITGGIGATCMEEAFSYPYDLPNDTAYSETCAAIGLVFFARRMLEIEADRKYGDIMELALYNTVLAGMAKDGKCFFYVNPLESLPLASDRDKRKLHVKPVRQKWFGCACCPPNIARLLSSLGSYIFTASADTLYTHLLIGGKAEQRFSGKRLILELDSCLPWEGRLTARVRGEETRCRLAFRIPSWSRQTLVTIRKDGTEQKLSIDENGAAEAGTVDAEARNGYLYLGGTWTEAELTFEYRMEVMLLRANNRVREDTGKLAVRRGPLVYCLEEADNGKNLHLLRLDRAGYEASGARLREKDDLDPHMIEIVIPGIRDREDQDNGLYLDALDSSGSDRVELRFIPYYAWNNRGEGEMSVFLRL